MDAPRPDRLSGADRILLVIAQGFGSGRAPKAPGTVGSLVGLAWAWLLLLTCPNPAWFGAGCLAGIAVSVRVCGEAERILARSDPGSVVLDEIIALPICFLGWLLLNASEPHPMPETAALFGRDGLILSVGIFGLFRIFDVWKPWPVFQIQSLPGGWGVTLDDVAAAVYVNLILALGHVVFDLQLPFGSQ